MDFTNAFWSPFKDLLTTVQYTIYHKRVDLIREYQNLLKQHTNNFTSLLVFPKPNAKHRAELNKGPKEGTTLSSTSLPKKLPARLVQEVLLLSDVLDLNEFSSLELLLVGEDQSSRYPGWTRGLVATVLYHDGRRSLLTSLKTILQAKRGESWSISLPEEVDTFTQQYINVLLDGELVKQIFDQLRVIDVQNELVRLEKGGGVGDQRHRALLSYLISDQRQILSDCLFTLSCQDPLNKKNCLELLHFLRETPQITGDGTLDGVTMSVLFSFLTSIDVGHLFENETGDELTLNDTYPILSDPTYIPDVTEELMKDREWKCKGLKGCVLFAWGQLLRICASATPFSDLQEIESDEALTDAGINLGVFRFLTDNVVASDTFHSEEIYVRKLHKLVTSYIVNMQTKDEENFMFLISALYGIDHLSLELSRDFWQVNTSSHHLNIPLSDSMSLTKRRPSAKQTALFNFVRSNGEHLQPDMFTVYLTMLNGLSCGPTSAQHCFALLRAFSSYTGSYVSLDHLFNSMKQYADSFSTQGTAGQVHMTTNELEAMNAVLKLLASLAKWDQTVRISLIEQPWQSLHTLTSLVACPIPCTLKAGIFNLLANLNKTPEVAVLTWQALEGINIIAKPEKIPTKYTQGIILELQKVEARNETYPETRGFLHLLDELTNHPIPNKLLFSNYLNFLIDEVYLNIDKRVYHDSEEEWEMLCDVLQIIHKLVRMFSPETALTSGRVSEDGGVSEVPGAVILTNLLHDSPFLHQLLATLHCGYKILKEEEDVRAAKSHNVDRACLLSLQLLEEGLEKGEVFKKLNSTVGSHALLSSLGTLLLGLNPTTKKADHLLVITTFVSLQLFSPELALSAVNILCSVSSNPSVAKQLCSILTHDPLLSTDILDGFIQRIEVEDWETYEESDILSKEDRNVTSSITSSHIRIRILQLILLNLSTPAPNLAHLLLGFEIAAPVRQTVLQDPGIAGNNRTCLHAILYLISPLPTPSNHFTCHSYAPIFSQLAYQVLYTLCSHVDLSAATLRYLRSSKDFLYLQMKSVPFFQLSLTGTESKAAESHLELSLQHQQSWLLRMVALELHVTTKKQQRSHTQKLVNLLLADEKEAPVPVPVRTDVKSFRAVEEEVIMLPSAPGKTARKISAILSQMDISEIVPPPLELNYFNQEQILSLIQQHQAKSDLMDMRIIDIKSLHKFINKEMTVANIGLSQKQPVLEEMKLILSFSLEQNQAREQTEVKKSLFESWHHMTDTLLLSCQEELLPKEIKFPLLLELASIILEKALSPKIIVEVIPTLTSSLLTIFSHLSYIHIQNIKETNPILLDTPAMRPLLTSIIDLLSRVDTSIQSTRTNLYGVLLYYFQMCRRQGDVRESQDIYMRESKVTLQSMTMSVFNSYGDSLVEIVCRDAFDSTNIIQNLSFSLLEQILLFDEDVHWLKTINILGYLRYIVDSIGKQDTQLVTCVRQGGTTLEQLFYEAKISFLTRVAMCFKGPELLSQANLFFTISNMSFIDLRPEMGVLQPVSAPVSSKSVSIYSQLFLPLLRLLLTVLSTAAKRHYDIIFQVTQLVNSHSEIIFSILRSHTNTCTIDSLQELNLVSSLVSLSCAHYMQQSTATDSEVETTSEPLKALCLRVQRLMLSLLSTYCFKSQTSLLVQQVVIPEGRDEVSVRREATLYTLQIANSILRYAAVTMNRDGLDMDITTPKIIFNTEISSPVGSEAHGKSHVIPTSTLSIGSLLQIINDYTNVLIQESEHLSKLEFSHMARIVESSLYLLWKHLELYLVFVVDKSLTTAVQPVYQGDQSRRYPSSPNTAVHQTKLNKFKQEIKNKLTQEFYNHLQQVEDKISDPGAPPQARFIDITVQNIKKLILQNT